MLEDRGPKSDRSELTVRALIVGAILGAVVASVNVYMGLQIGLTEGGSIFAAIVGFALLRILAGGSTKLENNIIQTTASGAGSLAGLMITVVAALSLLGRPMSYLEMTLYVASVAFLGVFYAIPLRRQLIVVDRLPFPSGTATAATINALHAGSGLAQAQARTLGVAGVLSATFVWFRDGIPAFIKGTLFLPLDRILGFPAQQLTLGIRLSPMLFAAGLIVGPRVGASLLAGGIVCWGILGPWLASSRIINPDPRLASAVREWTVWPGMALLIAYGLAATFLRWRTLVDGLRLIGSAGGDRADADEVSRRFWLIGFAMLAFCCSLITRLVFDIPLWMGLSAVALSFVLALVSVRAAGETGINPTGTMGHTTQMVYGAIARGVPQINLLTAGITSAGASQAADLLHDLKAGHLLGASARRQVYAQLVGVLAGILVVVPVFFLFVRSHGLGSEALPAPVAGVWREFARLVAEGGAVLPRYAGVAALAGAGLGTGLAVLDRTRARRFTPSAVGLGVAMLMPAMYSIAIFLGSMGEVVFRRATPKAHQTHLIPVASGCIVGEGLMAIFIAALLLAGVLAR